jgi:hypothetical protein
MSLPTEQFYNKLFFYNTVVLGQIVTLIQDLDPFLHKWVRVQVPRDREVEARELLEPLLEGEASPQLAGEEE